MPENKPKDPKELAKHEINKRVAKKLADIEVERMKLRAKIKKLDRLEKKILAGDIMPENISVDKILDEDDEDDTSSTSTTQVALLLDESGSMSGTNVVESVNNYLKELSGKSKFSVTITKFGGQKYEIIRKNVSPKRATLKENEYQPNGFTPLYDAIGRTISSLREDRKTLFVIITDGHENSSKEYNHDQIKTLITKQEKKKWNFVFLGADLDEAVTRSVGHSLGFSSSNIGTIKKTHLRRSMKSLAGGTIAYSCCSDVENYGFVDKHMKKPKRKKKND